jgi:hypothetical protein
VHHALVQHRLDLVQERLAPGAVLWPAGMGFTTASWMA